MDSQLSEEFEVKEGMHQGRICAVTFSFCSCVRCCCNIGKCGVLKELMCADNLILISKTIEGFLNKLIKCRDFLEQGFESSHWENHTWHYMGTEKSCL